MQIYFNALSCHPYFSSTLGGNSDPKKLIRSGKQRRNKKNNGVTVLIKRKSPRENLDSTFLEEANSIYG